MFWIDVQAKDLRETTRAFFLLLFFLPHLILLEVGLRDHR